MPKTPWRGTTRSVPHSDLQDKALGVGDPNSADKSVGKQNARWARVDLTGGGTFAGTPIVKEYDVAHDLKQTTTSVTLESYERSTGPATITARGVRQEGWSHSHAFVEVTLLAGSLEGCVAVFKVSGR